MNYQETEKHVTPLKMIIKAMKATFEQKSQIIPDHVAKGIEESLKQADEGQLTLYTRVKDMLKN